MSVIGWIKETSNRFTTKVCNTVLSMNPCNLEFVPDRFKTEEMCNEKAHRKSCALRYVPGHLKTQEMCEEAVRIDPWLLYNGSPENPRNV